MEKKEVTYLTRNTVSVLNELTPKTTYAWVIFHGMGYLSRYFLRYFDGLDPDTHLLVAPQAPSKYYLDEQFKNVGASWLTKEDTALEMENILSYMDAVMEGLSLPKHLKLVVFGYSQGVSIAMRWVVKRNVKCDHLILYAGGIPEEILPEDVSSMLQKTQVRIIVGTRDEYITPERWEKEEEKIELLFKGMARVDIFDGQHEIKKDIINTLP